MKDGLSGPGGWWALWLVVMACTALRAQSVVDGAASTWASRFYVVPPAAASVEVIPAVSPDGASEAIRARVTTTGAEAWRVGTSAVLTVPVTSGQVLRWTLWARRRSGSGPGILQMKFEDPTRNGDPSNFSESGVIHVTSEAWTELQGELVSKVALPAGATQWVIFLGGAIQDIELSGLRLEPVCAPDPSDWLGRMELVNAEAGDSMRRELDPVAGCFHRLVTTGGREPFRPQCVVRWTEPVWRGDLFRGTVRMRRGTGGGSARVGLMFQRVGLVDGDWGASFEEVLEAGGQWELRTFEFLADRDFNGTSGDTAQWAVNFGYAAQTVDLADLRLVNLGPVGTAHPVLAGFRRGMNLGNVLEHASCPPENPVGPADLEAIRAEGFDHVRVPVAWQAGSGPAPGFTIDPCRFEWVDLLVTHAVQRGLGVVIDLHGFSEFMRDPVGERARFIALWRQVAVHYAAMPTNVVFELLNEPFGLPPGTDDALNQAYAEALAAIRSSGGANGERLVLLSPAERSGSTPHEEHWRRLDTLRFPAGDPHVGATVHNYDPFLFTHQGTERRTLNGVGTGWTDPAETSTRGIRFPGPPDVPVAVDPRVTAAWALGWLGEYNDRSRIGNANPSSATPIRKFAATVKLWSIQSGRPVYVGEFGAFTGADAISRANYARTARALFEEFGLGWAWWNWNSDFRYVERPAGGVFRVEPLLLRTALVPGSVLGAEPVVIDVRARLSLGAEAGERVRLKVSGVPGVKYSLEGAKGLGSWRPVGEGWSVSGAWEMTVPALEAQEFFRAVAP